MKDLNEIKVFARVAQLGSFSQAAQSLGMPVSTVSRKVSDLEARLGVTLIQRTTRKLNLTEIGTRYYQSCSELLQGFDEAETQATQAQEKFEGLLRISIPVGMASDSFTDFVSDFLSRYPGIQLDLVVTNEFVDLVDEGVDLAIRFGSLRDSSLIAKRLGTSKRALVAAPSYLKKHGMPKHPHDLETHECLVYRAREPEFFWELTKDKQRLRVEIKGRVMASDMLALSQLAVRGHGLALIPRMYCENEIRAGRLRAVLPDWESITTPVHAVFLNRRFMPARISVFIKELEAWPDQSWQS